MASNSRPKEVIRQLQEAGDEGVPELELFPNYEGPGNVGVIKHRVRKELKKINAKAYGGDVITVEAGRWFLSEEYRKLTPAEFQDILQEIHIDYADVRSKFTMAFLTTIFLLFSVWMYNVGKPNSVEQCNAWFSDSTIFEYEYE